MTSEFAIAVHTLVFLNHVGGCQPSEKIAENVCTNPVTIRRILSKLKKAQLVETKEGIDGGYCFTLEAGKVSLDRILNAIGEKPVSVSKKTGNVDYKCQIASNMGNIMEDVYSSMNMGCMEKIKNITIVDIDSKIFRGEGGENEKI